MKKNQLFKILGAVALLMAAVLGYFFSDVDSGVLLAMPAAAGVGAEGQASVEAALAEAEKAGIETIIDDEFENKVVQFYPDRMPLDTLIRKIGKRRSTSVLNPGLFSVDYKKYEDTVATSTVTAAATSAYIKPNTDRLFSKGDTVQFKGIAGYDKDGNVTPYVDLWGYVYDVNATSGLAVQPINGKLNAGGEMTFGAAVPVNTTIYRGSKPGTETQMRTVPSFALPGDDFNYVQKFMGQVDVSDWSEMHKKKAKWGKSEMVNRAMYDFRATKELAYLRGARSKTYSKDDNVNEPIYTCGGFTYFNNKVIDWSGKASLTDKDFVGFTEEIFDGNSGSSQRLVLAGSKVLTDLQNAPSFMKMLEAQKTEIIGGIKMTVMETVYGRLLIYRHPLFREVGWGNAAVVLDFDNITELQFESIRRKEIDYKQNAEKQATGTIFWETACPQYAYPDTHRFIVGLGGL